MHICDFNIFVMNAVHCEVKMVLMAINIEDSISPR